MSTQEIIKRYKYWIYGYILWLMPNIAFLIVGGNGRRFFPFGSSFFDLYDYGFIELVVYAVALPITIFIISDTLKNSKKARLIAKWLGVTLVYLIVIFFVFIVIRCFIIGFFGLFFDDLLYAVNHNWSFSEVLLDFSDTLPTVFTIVSLIITLIIAILIFRESFINRKVVILYLIAINCLWIIFSSWMISTNLHFLGYVCLFGGIILGPYLAKLYLNKRKHLLGRTKDQCIRYWGKTSGIMYIKKAGKKLECWDFPSHYLLFKDDILQSIEEKVTKGYYSTYFKNKIFSIHLFDDNSFLAGIIGDNLWGSYKITYGEVEFIFDNEYQVKYEDQIWSFGDKHVICKSKGSSFSIQLQHISKEDTRTYKLTLKKTNL